MKITMAKELKQKPDSNSLGFGKYFTDHMLVMRYDAANGGWQETEIIPYSDFSLDPASCVLHYGQGIFEGLKAYKNDKGEITMFRPSDNFKRMNRSAERLCMPTLDVDRAVSELEQLVELEKEGYHVTPTASAALLTMNREGIRRLAAETLGITTSKYVFASTYQ